MSKNKRNDENSDVDKPDTNNKGIGLEEFFEKLKKLSVQLL